MKLIYTKNACWLMPHVKKFLLVMKITTLLLIISIMQVSATGFAQKLTFSQRQVTFKNLFKEIKKQTGYSIFYSNQKLDEDKKLDVDFSNTPLDEVLEKSLENLPLTFSIDDKAIFIKEKEKSLLDNLIARFQAIDVRGKVVDSLWTGLAGATVKVKNGRQSTYTDANGNFYLRNVEEGVTLEISFLGYITKEIPANKDFNEIQLQLSTSKLDEVQIQAYGKTSKRLSTGNIVTIKGEELAKQPVTNPLMALQGRVPNLVITPTSGQPNGAVSVQLRGQNSLSTKSRRSEPLIIVDGVPYQNTTQVASVGLTITGDQVSALSLINVNDIEQIDVLSDADATSIYGSRGGNGVILITTKRGKAGPTRVNATITTGISQVPTKLELMSTTQYLEMRRQSYINDALPVPDHNSATKNLNNYDLTVWDHNRNTDWQEEFLGKNARSYSANVSVQGGTKTIQYLIGGNYSAQGNVYPGNAKYENGITNLNISGNTNDGRFKVLLSTAVTFNKSLSPGSDFTRLAVTLAPNAPPLYTAEGSLNWEPDQSFGGTVKPSTWTNPYAQLLRNSDLGTLGLRGSSEISYQIIKSLQVKLTAGYNQNIYNNLSLYPIASQDPAASPLGYAYHSNTKNQSFTFDPQILYSRFLGKSKLEFLLGASYQSQSNMLNQLSAENYTSDALLKSLSSAGVLSALNSSNEYKYIGGFARLNYNFDSKYILNLSGRRDGSSRFGPGYQFGNFWSVGSAWIFTEEPLLKKISKVLSYGKVRASFGTSGNDGISDYQYLELYRSPSLTESIFTYQGVTPVFSSGAFNNDYRWESIKKLEFELTTGFFNDKITLTSSYWRTRGYKQLGNYRLPATAGASVVVRNQNAVIQNAGWDFFLDSRIIDRNGFKWNTSINFGLSGNKIISLPEGIYDGFDLGKLPKVGDQFSGYTWTYKYRGVNIGNGLYQFDDLAGNPTTSNENFNATAVKVDTRPITMGLSNSFGYKGISCSFFIQLTRQIGRNYLFDPAFTRYNTGSFSSNPEFGNLPVAYITAWKNAGELPEFQRLTSTPFTAPVRSQREKVVQSDAAWVDASFVRLRNVSLSYNFPEKLNKKIGMKGVTIFLNGQNLLTITKYKGLDPETQSVSVLPLLRTWNGGLQINL